MNTEIAMIPSIAKRMNRGCDVCFWYDDIRNEIVVNGVRHRIYDIKEDFYGNLNVELLMRKSSCINDILNVKSIMLIDDKDELYNLTYPNVKSVIIDCKQRYYQVIKVVFSFDKITHVDKMLIDEPGYVDAYVLDEISCKHVDGTVEQLRMKSNSIIDLFSKTLTFKYNGWTKPPELQLHDVIEFPGISFRISDDTQMLKIKSSKEERERHADKLRKEIDDLEDEDRKQRDRIDTAYKTNKHFRRLLLALHYNPYEIEIQKAKSDIIRDKIKMIWDELNSVLKYENDHFMDNVTITYGIDDISVIGI